MAALQRLLALALLALVGGCSPSAPSTEVVAGIRDQLAKCADRSGIEIDLATESGQFPNPHGTFSWKAVTERDLVDYTKLFLAEFALYSRDFLQDIGVRRVCLCQQLAFGEQARMALPEFGSHTLYLDTAAVRAGAPYARRVIHHELFHLIDYADDGAVYEDASWCSLNPAGWRYGTGGKNAQDKPESSILTDKYPGFVSYYSTTGVEEDKAELYSSLIAEPRTVDMLSARDPVLLEKLMRMGVLLRAASPHAGADLWNRIHAPQRK